MSSLLLRFSLLCAVTILQSTASNGDPLVSLKCNDPEDVVAEENVTLNCRIISSTGEKCTALKCCWKSSHGDIQCDSSMMKYTCSWDSQTVYLAISNVTKEENYTVIIRTDCGQATSSAIKVKLQQDMTTQNNSVYERVMRPEDTEPLLSQRNVITPILGIIITLAVVGILYFLFGTNRGGKIISRMKREKIQGGDDSEPGNEISLII